MNKFLILLLVTFFTCSITTNAQHTPTFKADKISINNQWKFHKSHIDFPSPKAVEWQSIDLPHTWNNKDAVDDMPGYYRGDGWYSKTITVSGKWKNKQVYLYFEGANQEADIYVNQQLAGSHKGGYTRFYIPISAFIDFSSEDESVQIDVKVSNAHNEDIPPLSADFTFFGGIYRDVYLVLKDQVHFDFGDLASSGVKYYTTNASVDHVDIHLVTQLANESTNSRDVLVTHLIKDAAKKVVQKVSEKVKLGAGESKQLSQTIKKFKDPELWSPEHPYLYEVSSIITDAKTDEQLDEIRQSLGVRWFSFTVSEGFKLNGQPYKLIGTNRHQDFKGLGNALSDALHISDISLLKQMGGNFLRISHYPQAPEILQMCDKLGIITSVEIPIVNRVTDSEGFKANSQVMLKEMIAQNYNHPSVVIWAYMNEVLLSPRFNEDSQERADYYKKIQLQAQALDDIARAEDPHRYTMIANHGWFDGYFNNGLAEIPMVVGWNLYQGWYGADITGFEKFLDMHHSKLPDVPMIVTEYGAGADPRLHSFAPERFDFTIEYETYYHQHYLPEILKRPFVVGANVWNLNDFYSEGRGDAVPHVNNKGLVSLDRQPKEVFYYYQAALTNAPLVKIGNRNWKYRSGIASKEEAGVSLQPLKVFSNQGEVRLIVNGKELETKKMENFTASWMVPFKNGNNLIEAVAESETGEIVKDFAEVHFELLPFQFDNSFEAIHINVGAHSYFHDPVTHQVWLPDQAYKKGQYGWLGNAEVKAANANILKTENDPLFQVQQSGLSKYKLDVAAGEYELVLHFAELLSHEQREELVYNLGQDTKQEKGGERVFDVNVNGKAIITSLNLAKSYGEYQPVSYKVNVPVADSGLTITFDASVGRSVLNALELRKIY